MTTAPTIRRQPPDNPALRFDLLRQAGLERLQMGTGALWTDHNLHDPGITILEVLCYALVDLGYRTAFPIEDLLASGDGASGGGANFAPFGPALETLPSRPVTARDYRKLLLDLRIPDGGDLITVRNAFVSRDETTTVFADLLTKKLAQQKPGHIRFESLTINGLYEFLVELVVEKAIPAETPAAAPELAPPTPEQAEKAFAAIRQVYQAQRNLGEDLGTVRRIEPQPLVICLDLDLHPNADVARVLAEAEARLDAHLAPPLPRYSLAELLAKPNPDGSRRTVEEILEGTPPAPVEGGQFLGFWDDDELDQAELPPAVYASDLIRLLTDLDGVAGVRHLQLNHADDPAAPASGYDWILPLQPGKQPVWSQKFIHAFKDVIPVFANPTDLTNRRKTLADERAAQRRRFVRADLEPQPPRGRDRRLTEYVPLRADFPLVYGVGPAGLSNTASPQRRAQASQLRGYLAVFDQFLANYLSQLAHIGELFSVNEALGRTYFAQVVEADPLLWTAGAELETRLNELTEASSDNPALVQRRGQLFDHLLSRVAESFNEIVLHRFATEGEKAVAETVADKAAFLAEYPSLSRNRGGAADVTAATPDVSGFEHRLARLLGLSEAEKPVLVEHHLLRPHPAWPALPPAPEGITALLPLCLDEDCDDCQENLDPYSFRLTLALPARAERFRREDQAQQLAFRAYTERVIRQELPAHLAPKVCWVDEAQFAELQTRWTAWLTTRRDETLGTEAGRQITAELIQTLFSLHNLYPKGTLLDQDPNTPNGHAIVLGRTALGTLEEP